MIDLILNEKYNAYLIKVAKGQKDMHHNSKIIASINWLSSKNRYKGYDLIEEAEQRNLKFMEILKRYGFELYEHTFISQLLKKINDIKHFVYNKSVEYIADLPDDYATYDLKMMKAYHLTGILRVNFTIDEMIKEANELSLSEVSLLLNKIKFWLPDTKFKKTQKLTIIIEPVADYFLNLIYNEISVVILVKKKGVFSQPFALTRVSIPIIGQTDYEIENSLRKVILLTKFYSFLDDTKWKLLAGVIEEDK